MGGWNECPRGLPPQNQLVVTKPDVVGWIGLAVIKLKEFQWACKFENQGNESSSEGQSWAFLLSNEYHIWGAEHSDLGCTSSGTRSAESQAYLALCSGPLPCGKGHSVSITLYRCPILSLLPTPALGRKLLVLFISHKHSRGNPSGETECFKPEDEKCPRVSLSHTAKPRLTLARRLKGASAEA